mgnify:CR=1 FL=1
MENTELMNNEVIETEEIAETCEEKDYSLLVAGIGIGVVAGIAAYNYVIKPVTGKVKDFIAKKKAESKAKKDIIVLDQNGEKVS